MYNGKLVYENKIFNVKMLHPEREETGINDVIKHDAYKMVIMHNAI